MLRQLITGLAGLPILAFAAGALADTSLGIRAGTLGAGVELSHAFGPHTGVRLNGDAFSRSTSRTEDNIQYDAKLRLRTASLLGDWFPFGNGFRISAGGVANGNKINLRGKPTGSTYTINGRTYNASDVGSLEGQVDFNKLAPYAGLGYGRALNKGLSLIFDAGVMHQGSPKSKITVICGPAIVGTAQCTQLQNDAAAEQARLDDSLKKYKNYPVLSLGLAYTF